MALNLEQINLKFKASIGNVGNTFTALEKRLTKLNSALNSVNTTSIDRMANSFEKFSRTMNGFAVNDKTNSAIRSLATTMNKLGSVDTASVSKATSVLMGLNHAMSATNVDIAKATAIKEFAKALGAFSLVKPSKGAENLPALAAQIKPFMTAFETVDAARFQSIASALQTLSQALSILGRTKVDQAIVNLPLLAKEMENLMRSLARAPNVSDNIIKMTTALAQLASNGNKVGTATASLNRALNNTSTSGMNASRGIRLFGNSAKSAKSHIKSLSSVVGGLIAKYWILWRAVQVLGNMAGVASSLVEVQNVVNHTFGNMQNKIDDFAKTSIDSFGLSTLAVKQYASRFQSMGMAMGLTNSQVAQTSQFVSSKMTEEAKALYNTTDSLADMSINLTKLSADYASFYDVDPSETFEKFQSVLTGMARPLRAYGLDLSQTSVQEWALRNGLEANMLTMTQAEKTLLRYQYVMANSNHILADFSRTSDRDMCRAA